MKKIVIFIVILFSLTTYYFYSQYNMFIKNLSTHDKVGLATDFYLISFRSYPYWYSNFLFNKYEREKLYLVAKENPEAYLNQIGLVYAVELKEDLNYLYSERIYEIEDALICIGLDKNRVKIYREHLILLNKDQFFAKKYNSFKDDTVFKYCNNKDI